MRSMTPEERFERIERQLEFLATNQAQLSASVETLRDVASRHDDQIAENFTQIGSLRDLLLRLGRIVEEQGRRMDEGFARLTEAQQRTDERLNTLINVVERYFSNGHK